MMRIHVISFHSEPHGDTLSIDRDVSHVALNGATAPPLAQHSATAVQHTTPAHRSTTARTGVPSRPPTLPHMSAPAGAAATDHGDDATSQDLNGQCRRLHQ